MGLVNKSYYQQCEQHTDKRRLLQIHLERMVGYPVVFGKEDLGLAEQ